MGCGCNSPIMSWYDLENHQPKNPFDLIAYADLDGIEGSFEFSSDFLSSGGGFVDSPVSYNGDYKLVTWATDSGQMNGDAMMWQMQHKMINIDTNLPPALQKMAFLRGGTQWKNIITFDIAVDVDYLLLSFLENAGTRGDAQAGQTH